MGLWEERKADVRDEERFGEEGCMCPICARGAALRMQRHQMCHHEEENKPYPNAASMCCDSKAQKRGRKRMKRRRKGKRMPLSMMMRR